MNNNMIEKYLPIGSVIILKEATKRLMITGFCVIAKENNLMYDYCGCLYPEGIVSSDNIALFNHEQIDKIYFVGLSDVEEKEFKVKLNLLLHEKRNSSDNNISDRTEHLLQQQNLQSTKSQNTAQESIGQQIMQTPMFNTLNLNHQNDTNNN